MEGAKDDAKGAWHDLAAHYRTTFEGFRLPTLDGVKVVGLFGPSSAPAASLTEGQTGEVLLEATPFYGEAGGQVGDTGWIVSPAARVRVDDTYRPAPGLIASRVTVEAGRLAPGEYVTAEVDGASRAIKRNHTATTSSTPPREVVAHVKQAGSLVAPDGCASMKAISTAPTARSRTSSRSSTAGSSRTRPSRPRSSRSRPPSRRVRWLFSGKSTAKAYGL